MYQAVEYRLCSSCIHHLKAHMLREDPFETTSNNPYWIDGYSMCYDISCCSCWAWALL
jgi:hypothetical protein